MSRPIGPDISKWQANGDPSKPHGVDFKRMHSKADFILMRAGYAGSAGGAWTDERVEEYMADLGPLLAINPIPFSFYWFFRDDVSIMEQAQRFTTVVNRWSRYVNLPLVVDAEVFVKDDALSTQKLADFKATVEALTEKKIDILYGRASQLNPETVPDLSVPFPNLWIARYASVNEPWGNPGDSSGLKPRDWDDWRIWQYTSTGPGADWGVVSASIDLNYYNGTLEELRHWAGLDEPTLPPPVTGDGYFIKYYPVNVDAQADESFLVIDSDVKLMPQALEITAPDNAVRYANIYLEIDGSRIKIDKMYIGARSWRYYEVPNYIMIGNGAKIIVGLEPANGGQARVALVAEEWDW